MKREKTHGDMRDKVASIFCHGMYSESQLLGNISPLTAVNNQSDSTIPERCVTVTERAWDILHLT